MNNRIVVATVLAAAFCLLQVPQTARAGEAKAPWPFFAMDTGTRDANHATAESQAAMLKELGYAGIGPMYGSPKALADVLAANDKLGLKVFAVYIGLNIDAGKDAISPQLKDAIAQLKGRDAMLWLFVTSKKHKASSLDADAEITALLSELADLAQAANVRIAIYPHTGMVVEKLDDALRLTDKVNKKNLGVTFNLCHWLKTDGKDLEPKLKAALPRLFVVSINGADTGGKDWKTLIQPLDAGTYDVIAVMALLAKLGYTGPVGLQGYGIKGDVHENLRRSMDAWKKMTAKITASASATSATPSNTASETASPEPASAPASAPLAAVPAGAVELIGKDFAAWTAPADWKTVGEVSKDPANEKKLVWKEGAGVAVNGEKGRTKDLVTKAEFGDVQIHAEFMVPKGSNSGMYLMGRYELQVYDSFGVEKDQYPGIECGGIYPRWIDGKNVEGHSPRVNASKAPGEWQTFDITFRAPKFDAAGKKFANACFVKVVHNGQIIHENVELTGPTRGGATPEKSTGPLRIQGDHGPVAYRNLWVLPTSDGATSKPAEK